MSSCDVTRMEGDAFPLTQNAENESSKFKILGFAVLIIFGVGGLIVAGIGTCGLLHAGSLTNLGQRNSVIMIVIGGAGGIPPLAIGIMGFVNSRSGSSSRIRELIPQAEGDELLEVVLQNLGKGTAISTALQGIPEEFFAAKSQERAKHAFSKIMGGFGSDVYFPQTGPYSKNSSAENLDLSVFQLSVTQGVELDIPNSSKDTQHVHIYQVASQYNAAEAANRYTPLIGTAMRSSENDHTQGPLAQRTNPKVFECVTAFLTHLGFNMLRNVLPSAGKTYQKGSSVEHGYLCATNETIGNLTQEFEKNFSQAEYVCYSSFSDEWGGSQPVYIMLQAAPAIGYSFGLTSSSDELQKYAALANYLAFFRQGIAIAKSKDKPVVLHAAAVGGGVFGNAVENLQWGFTQAALALQEEMKSARVSVQLEAHNGEGHLKGIADNLKILTKNRIGG